MIKDIKYYMSDTDQSFEDFLRSCDDLINGKYILADGKISAILQHIASSRKTYALFDGALNGFDFGYEFSRAKQPTGYNTETIRLPKNKEKAIAFVFCLLLEFDMGQRKLKDFLHVYFYNDNPNVEFAAFIREIMVPFRATAAALFYGGEQGEHTAEGEAQEELCESEASLSLDMMLSELNFIADRLSHLKMSEGEADEALYTLQALQSALSGSNPQAVKLAYIAFKNTLAGVEICAYLMDDVLALGEKLSRLQVLQLRRG